MAKLHVHTKYSLLDAITEPEALVRKCAEQGDKALCVTEHGNVYSDVEVCGLCRKYGIKYLYGCEMYICGDVGVRDRNGKYFHLVVIAKNEAGRLNLNRLVSESCRHKYYKKPRIDFHMLEEHREGLIVLSACMAGEVQRRLAEGDGAGAEAAAKKYRALFGDDYYLEYQSHSDEAQQRLNRQVVDLAARLGIKYVVTTDAHYLEREDQKYHDMFVRIGQSREAGETYNDCFVQSDAEILEICRSTTREENAAALRNTDEIAEKCSAELPLSAPIMPHVDVPDGFGSELAYLRKLCIDGWREKGIGLKPGREEYKKRLGYEMKVIGEMGFEGYYLFVRGYAAGAARRGIARGSGAGSLVAYLAGITDIDPVEYGLYFERFIDVGALDLLKEGRISRSELKIPDFDVDFGQEDREKAVRSVIDRYGRERVASLGSFQYIWAKGSIKDIGRALGIPFEVTSEMTSKLGDETMEEIIRLGLLDGYREKHPELFEYAERLSGLPKSFSAHPCGKVCSTENDIVYYNATDVNDGGEVILQGDMHAAESLGLIKADFLGLRTIDVIYDTLEMIGEDYGYIAPHALDFGDPEVLRNFREGNTAGVFQFESAGMRELLGKMECGSLEELSVANALYRPGSIRYADDYAARKKGEEDYGFLHPDLEPILGGTYGIIVFQEQLIEIGRLAGLRNPDELRKATAKKDAALMEKTKPELYAGLSGRGWSREQLDGLWEMMTGFAKYSFNKSHAVAYAMTAYICMYLKVRHPKEYICSWANSVSGRAAKLKECAAEAARLGIPVCYGEYDRCSPTCAVCGAGIMMGTNTVKYCGPSVAEELMALSREKEYASFIDLLDDIGAKTSVNSRQLGILAGLGFFSRFGGDMLLLKMLELYGGAKGKDPETGRPSVLLPPLRTCSQISKDRLDGYAAYGLTERLVRKHAGKETARQYREIDGAGLLRDMMSEMPDERMDAQSRVRFEEWCLGYSMFSDPSLKGCYYIVTGFRTRSDPSKPYLELRNLKTGRELEARIRNGRAFRRAPFGRFAILKIEGFTTEFKRRLSDGKWVCTGETVRLVEEYEVAKDG